MTRRSRVRPVLHAFSVALAVMLASPASPVSAQSQPYPEPPSRDDLPVEVSTDWSDEIPAHVSVVDGAVELERDGQREAAEENVPLLAGDRLRTGRGRVEVLFSDGSALALDEHTDVDLLSDSLLRVQAGRVRLAIARGAGELAYRVDAGGTTAWLRSAGEYRIVVDSRGAASDVFVTALRGTAELETPAGRTLIRTGFEARASQGSAPSLPYTANVSAWSAFDRWVDEQQRYRTGARSAQYLPAELRQYSGAFDQGGAWEYAQGYGYVWYPQVAVDWRPYYHGGWSFVGAFGWTWVGGGRWTWPTHHYGRWGLRNSRWFWIPGRRWGPAWVSWASAPGYLGWCPLGFDNRPVIAVTNIHVYGGDRRFGWTVVPVNRFGPRVAVSRWAVPSHNLNLAGGRFTAHAAAPARPSVAAARHVEPLRAPTYAGGRLAVSRGARSTSPTAASVTRAPGEAPSSAVGRARSAPSAGRPSNPVTRPSGPDEAAPPSRTYGVRSGSSRSRETSAPPSAPANDAPADRRASPRSPAPAATAPDNGSGSAPAGRQSAGPRRQSSSSATAPTFGERWGLTRRPTPVPSAGASSQRPTPSRDIGRASSPPRMSPTQERSASPRVERPMPIRPAPVERATPSRSIRSAPERAPRVERSTPSRSPRASASPPSSNRGGESRGQARGRNSR